MGVTFLTPWTTVLVRDVKGKPCNFEGHLCGSLYSTFKNIFLTNAFHNKRFQTLLIDQLVRSKAMCSFKFSLVMGNIVLSIYLTILISIYLYPSVYLSSYHNSYVGIMRFISVWRLCMVHIKYLRSFGLLSLWNKMNLS